jgi:hypothetical protein
MREAVLPFPQYAFITRFSVKKSTGTTLPLPCLYIFTASPPPKGKDISGGSLFKFLDYYEYLGHCCDLNLRLVKKQSRYFSVIITFRFNTATKKAHHWI